MAVITISRQIGCGGREIAQRLCDQLGYTYFDKRLMAEVAADIGLSADEVIDLSEENYKVKSFFERLLGRGSRVVTTEFPAPTVAGEGHALTVEEMDEERCVRFIQKTVRAAYGRGNVVILGRGGQAILKDMPGVLHVRLEAPEGTRITRVQKREGLSFSQAYQLMVDRDQATKEYLKEFFGIRWDEPLLYHLVINTGRLSIEAATEIIVTAVRQMEAVPA